VLLALGALLLVTTAQANHPAHYWELDGNWVDDPPGGLPDWSSVSPLYFPDYPTVGAQEVIITNGNSLLSSPYPYPTTTGNANDKADLIGAWLHPIVDGDQLYLYLAAQRAPKQQGQNLVDPGGNTSAIFALHRNPGIRSSGDLLIIMDFVNGGSTAVPQVLEWSGSAWVDVGVNETVALSISNPEGAIGPDGTAMPANIFVEAGIHLNDSALLDADSCIQLTQLWVMTASSQSDNANLQDVINGGAIDLNASGVDITDCATVTVEKTVIGPDADSEWEVTIAPNESAFTAQTLTHGGVTSEVLVLPGQPVTISEAAVGNPGSFAASWSCDNGASGDGSSFQLTLAAFAVIHCTFTNVMDEVPSISVDKSATPSSINEPGGNVAFTVTVTNDSSFDTVTVTAIEDDVYGNVADATNPAITGTTCSVGGSIAPGGQYQCQFTALVSGNAGQMHLNTVNVSVQDEEGNPTSGSDSETVAVLDVLPSISLTKTPSVASINEPGGPVVFTVVVTNTSTAESVTLTSLVDDVYGDLNGQGTCSVAQVIPVSGGTYQCSFEGLVNGAGGSRHTNVITAYASDDDGNNTWAQASASVALIDLPSAISVTKTADKSSVTEPGEDVVFTIVVTNDSQVASVQLTSLVDSVFGDLDGQGTCSVPQTIVAGASYSCAFTEFIDSAHVNVVTAVADDMTEFAQETVGFVNLPATMSVTKVPSVDSVNKPGADVTFVVTVNNTSAVDSLTINSMMDSVYGNLHGQGSCSVPQVIAAGGSYGCAFTAFIAADHANEVTVSATDNQGAPVTGSATAEVDYVDFDAVISVTKTPSVTQVLAPGANVTFTVKVTNASQIDTVYITDLVDQVGAVVTDLDGVGTCSVTPAQELAPGEAFSCSFSAPVTGAAGQTHTNTVTASGYDSTEGAVSASASAVVTIVAPLPPAPPAPVNAPAPPPATEPEPEPEPAPLVLGSSAQIEKVLTSMESSRVGELVTFRVTLRVTGDTTVTSVSLADVFEHEYLQYVGSSPANCTLHESLVDAGHSAVVCELGSMTPGTEGNPGEAEAVYNLTFRALASTLPGVTTNSALAMLDPDGDGPSGMVEIGPATADVEIIDVPTLQLPPTGDGPADHGVVWPWLMAAILGLLAFVATAGAALVRRWSGTGASGLSV